MKASTAILLIAFAGGAVQNQDKISGLFGPPPKASHVDSDAPVMLYSATWCGYCTQAKQYFKENNIAYTDLDIEHSERGKADYRALGRGVIPIIVINGDAPIRGFNAVKMGEVLGGPVR